MPPPQTLHSTDLPRLLKAFQPCHRFVDSRELGEADRLLGAAFSPPGLQGLDGHRFAATGDRIPLGEVSVHRMQWRGRVAIVPEKLPDAYMIGLAVAGEVRVRQGGQTLHTGSGGGVITSPLGPFQAEIGRSFDQILITLPRACLDRTWQALTGRSNTSPLVFDLLIPEDSPALYASLALLHSATHAASLGLDEAVRYFTERSTAQAISTLLLTQLPHSHRDLLLKPEPHWAPGYLRRAEAYLEAHLASPVTISDVAIHCGVSRRSLFAAFQKHRGTGPMRWLKERRLEAARKALSTEAVCATTVTSVAHTFGFLHLGEFASAYLARFGEYPSETLRRAGAAG